MKLIKGTALALALAFLVAGRGRSADLDGSWQEYSSAAGKFKILMPGQVQTLTRTENVPFLGKMTYNLAMATSSSTAYLVIYADFPGSSLNAATAEQMLDIAGPQYATGMKGKVLSQKKLSLGGNPGRAYLIEVPSLGIYVHARIYVVGRRVYFVNVMSQSQDTVTSAASESFLDSFKLANNLDI